MARMLIERFAAIRYDENLENSVYPVHTVRFRREKFDKEKSMIEVRPLCSQTPRSHYFSASW